MVIEIEVSGEELERIRKNRKEIEKRLRDVEGLERTLKALKYEILLEQKEKLSNKLKEMEVHYRELLEFEERAKRDREYMIRLRSELSRENETLRERIGGKK
ncbi:hypothetical protein [Thermococcus sp.]|uniref:hypothetical protein n=1 Tax=Thermococcus sp. TaxID=35749 RepID=UPI00262992FF|nr:hypothetical protein [Thermococcus sp.]